MRRRIHTHTPYTDVVERVEVLANLVRGTPQGKKKLNQPSWQINQPSWQINQNLVRGFPEEGQHYIYIYIYIYRPTREQERPTRKQKRPTREQKRPTREHKRPTREQKRPN
jgi:hypothetical protein